jgi:antitoxin component HigA of HigAB toxin-antitoxin module
MAARFSELSENVLSCLLEEKNAEITKKVTKAAVSVFRQYLEARQINEGDLVVGSKETLANVLRKF